MVLRARYKPKKPRYPLPSLSNPVVVPEWRGKEIAFHLSNWPYIGDAIRMYDNIRSGYEYLDLHKMTWSDVKYPSRLPGAGSLSSGVLSVSRSVNDLYRRTRKSRIYL